MTDAKCHGEPLVDADTVKSTIFIIGHNNIQNWKGFTQHDQNLHQ